MKKLRRIIALLLCIAFACPVFWGQAETDAPFALCSIESVIAKGKTICTIKGVSFAKEGSVISATVTGKSGSKATLNPASLTVGLSGEFAFSFEQKETEYTLLLKTETGEKLETTLDLAGSDALLQLGKNAGYSMTGVTLTKEGYTLVGTHSGKAKGDVTLTAWDALDELKAAMQKASDDNRNFEISFLLDPGTYTLLLEAAGLSQVSCLLSVTENTLSGSDAYMEGVLFRLGEYADDLDTLIAECTQKEIPTDYEKASVAIIREFMENIRFEAEHNDTSRVGQYMKILTTMYQDTKADLSAYLSGEKKAFAVPKYQGGAVEFDGTTILAETDTGGIKEKRPVFFTGFGHFETGRESIPFFASLGMNYANIGFTMEDNSIAGRKYCKNIMMPAEGQPFRNPSVMSTVEWELYSKYGIYIDYDSVDAVKEGLQLAEDYNFFVDVEMGLNHIPNLVFVQYPEAKHAGTVYLPFTLDHMGIRDFIALWFKYILSETKEYDALKHVILVNEPAVNTNYTNSNGVQYYKPLWQEFLVEKYGTIAALNQAYNGTTYADFSQVLMPTGMEATPLFNDYMDFNEGVINEFHHWLTQTAGKENPNILKSSKVMSYFRYNYPSYLIIGSNYEKVSKDFDINNCDAFSYWGNDADTPMPIKMGWYDYITSVNDLPAWDSESHILYDRPTVDYIDLIPEYVAADVWNGAVHGRSGDMLWLYDHRDVNMPYYEIGWSNANSNFALRPDSVKAVSTAAMDLNRLSKEVAALQKEQAKVGILFSTTSINYNQESMTSACDAYQEIIFSGQKAGFVTEEKAEDMHQYELLIVPAMTHVPKNMVQEINNYLNAGGKVLMLGNQALAYDENGKAHDASILGSIAKKADTKSTVKGKIQEMELSRIVLKDAVTGNPVHNIEWSYTEYGGYVVNILNYDKTEEKTVQLFLDGNPITTMQELRTGEWTNDGELCLKPYQPQLLAVKEINLTLQDENGNVLKENLDSIETGTVVCQTPIEGNVVLALYKDDELMKVSLGTGKLSITDCSQKGTYRLMATVWEPETLTPRTDCINIFKEVE